MRDKLRLNAFGPMEAVVDGAAKPLGPRKQRTLLAVLLCRAGAEVPTGEIVEALWGGRPPASAANNLRTYVHRLRHVVGEETITGSGRPGYRLRADLLDIDLADFSALCGAGESALDRRDYTAASAAFRSATALRRDRAFTGIDGAPSVDAEADRIDERWLLAVEQRIEADLNLGLAAGLVGELTSLTERHPYRERLAALLMLALYRSGRQAEALAVFTATATLLREQLAVEPGVELRNLHKAVLRQDSRLDHAVSPAPRVGVPAELPPVPDNFAGRVSELARLTALVEGCRDRARLPVIAIVGLAGAGKTTLATYWAHRVASGYPDGQLFIDLRGFSAEPAVDAPAALARMLRSLGVEANRVPDDVAERTALFRSLLADKRMLIVLDNASSAAQVMPLLPGGRGNAVIVTSRNRLPSLTMRCGAHQLEVHSLDTADARELLRRMVGADRIDAEPDATDMLVDRCGSLPLALCLAAADLSDDPTQTVAAYVDRHRAGSWVDTLGVVDDPGETVRAAFDLSYRTLTPRQQRLLGLLGLVPGPDFTVAAAAALTGGDPAAAGSDLARLAGAHLIQRRPHERFSFHDLIREYARNRAGLDRDAALDRLYAHYLQHTIAADRALYPGSLRLPADRVGSMSSAEATDWFEREGPALVAACVDAPRSATARLADSLGGHLWARYELGTWTKVTQAGAAAASDDHERAASSIALAKIADSRRDWVESMRRYEPAIDLARRAGWQFGEAHALNSAAGLHIELGAVRAAFGMLQDVLAMARRNGWRMEAAKALFQLGICHTMWGELTEAIGLLADSLALAEAEGSQIGRVKVLLNWADDLVLRREFDQAKEYAHRALTIAEEHGYLVSVRAAYLMLAAVERGNGNVDTGLTYALRSLTFAVDDRRGQGVSCHEVALAYDAAGQSERAIDYHRAAHRFMVAIASRYLEIEYTIALRLAEHRLGIADVAPDLRHCLDRIRDHGYRGLQGAALAALAEVCGDADLAKQALAIQSTAGWWTDPDHLQRLAEPGLNR